LQLAIAKIENSDLIIIDGADILDQGARGRLLQAVRSIGIPTIICMTLNKPDMAPNLAAAGGWRHLLGGRQYLQAGRESEHCCQVECFSQGSAGASGYYTGSSSKRLHEIASGEA
jgi:hypothetical protein